MKNGPAFGAPTISFNLDEEQVSKANAWAQRHRCSRAGMYGSAGDKFRFEFLPTGIGTFVTMHCSCGKQVDLTNDV